MNEDLRLDVEKVSAMEKLKPCPICGASAENVVYVQHESLNFMIRCGRCGCEKNIVKHIPISCEFVNITAAMDKVIERWNRRANDD